MIETALQLERRVMVLQKKRENFMGRIRIVNREIREINVEILRRRRGLVPVEVPSRQIKGP